AYRMYEAPLENTGFVGFSYLGVSQAEKPVILNPISGQTVSVPTITVEGTAGKDTEVTIYVNEIPRKVVRADKETGIWQATGVYLVEGKNEIKVQSEQLEFAASEYSDPIVIMADFSPVEIETAIEKKGQEILINAKVNKQVSKVATRLPNNQTLVLTYNPQEKLWQGKWQVPLKFMDKKITLQTRAVDALGNKTEIVSDRVSMKILKTPADRTVTTEDYLQVKGDLPAGVKQALVGGQVIIPNEDGSFETTVTLPELGKQLVTLEIIDEKGTTLTSQVRVLRKASAQDMDRDSYAYNVVNDLLTLGVISTDQQNNFAPKRAITRGELASLIADVKGLAKAQAKPLSDVPANYPYAAAITAVIDAGWMEVFTDGRFRPNDTLSRADGIIILVRINGLTVPEGTPDEIFIDVPIDHPAAGFIATAVEQGLVEVAEDNFNPDEVLDRETAVLWFSQAREIKEEIRNLMDWNQGYGLTSELTGAGAWESQLVVDFANVQWTAQEEAQGLKIISPIDRSTIYEEYAIVKGLVKEAKFVTVNGQVVAVENGAFVAAIPLDPGQNVIKVEAPKELKVIKVFREVVFEDVSKGTEGENLRLMGTLGYLDVDKSFYPEQSITRKELAVVLVRLKEDAPEKSSVEIQDIPADDPLLAWVKRAIDLGYFKLSANKLFEPNEVVRRADTISIINKFAG
ncbi:MAG: S-layer homology domain-containing protein, partial [Candidatus Margulisbacteria bacterium]|nr:S-layer homology domain-containing protein [Candidatus Margulisiibacteriota bacterium]